MGPARWRLRGLMLGSDGNAHFRAASFLHLQLSLPVPRKGVSTTCCGDYAHAGAEVAGRDLRLQPRGRWAMQTQGSWAVRTHLCKEKSIGRQGASFSFVKLRRERTRSAEVQVATLNV